MCHFFEEESLFNHDFRHAPPPIVLPASEERRCYGGYGHVPIGYVTVDIGTLDTIPDAAVRLDRRKYAIPLKAFAKTRRMTVSDQWSLNVRTMWPTIRSQLFPHRNKHRTPPSLYVAISETMGNGTFSDFRRLFWDIRLDNPLFCSDADTRISRWKETRHTLLADKRDASCQISDIESNLSYGGQLSLNDRRELNRLYSYTGELSARISQLSHDIDTLQGYVASRSLQ